MVFGLFVADIYLERQCVCPSKCWLVTPFCPYYVLCVLRAIFSFRHGSKLDPRIEKYFRPLMAIHFYRDSEEISPFINAHHAPFGVFCPEWRWPPIFVRTSDTGPVPVGSVCPETTYFCENRSVVLQVKRLLGWNYNSYSSLPRPLFLHSFYGQFDFGSIRFEHKSLSHINYTITLVQRVHTYHHQGNMSEQRTLRYPASGSWSRPELSWPSSFKTNNFVRKGSCNSVLKLYNK